MQALKTQRKVLRTAFTLCIKNIEAKLQGETAEVEEFSLLQVQLKDKFQRLEDCQPSIAANLLQDEGDETLFETDFDEAEKYRDRFLEVMLHLNLKLTEKVIPIDPPPKRNFKLPQLQLKKFNGDARDYLAFWSQFQKLRADPDIPNEDKMQYLIQVVEGGSKAERLVQSFPATASNYPKAIQQLQERFGRDELLVQIYVRYLLSVVMKNATTGRMKIGLPILYDELEGKLRALESLGKDTGEIRRFLNTAGGDLFAGGGVDGRNQKFKIFERLDGFSSGEVRSEEMILLARSGFGDKQCRRKEISIVSEKQTGSPTAAALVSLSSSGSETKPREKGLYAIEIKALDESFSLCLEALSEEKICGFVPKINDRIILRELKNRKIEITDSVSGEYEIDLLIGSDLLGSLLPGEIVELDCGLTAVHAKLGWTIMGKRKGTSSMGNIMTTLSMHCRSVNLTEMWDLECLGIIDPSQSLCRKKAHN
ncbi:hypothetical protein AVEN_57133-1 [Araneus ventricosus]|uniref:Peptidase aspartic putative domain-containing protein n=1 Tax=Araneus ventricosus TaxID=182803 RepID=A0A4Y2H9H8_ARAVE|nr:hypothetical protein AVEN_57133-1 [Araneus ventricosus]